MNIERIVFVTSIVIFSSLYGFVANKYNLFPASYINLGLDQGKAHFFDPPHHVFPKVYNRSGAKTLDAEKLQPGVTLLSSYWSEFDWHTGIKIIDSSGKVLHQWRADPEKIWPERVGTGIEARFVHGTYLFPDGDILFNIEYEGLVMMDACGDIKWKLGIRTNHSITRDEDGNFWIPAIATRTDNSPKPGYLKQFTGLRSPVYEDHLLKISPEGKILKDINLLKVIYENGLERYIPKISKRNHDDIFHLNDVEALSTEMAAEYPLFYPGDLLVSLKYMHLVIVIDSLTEKIKWHDSDLFIEQHDPDFTGDGWIAVFDNNSDFTFRGEMLGGSRIVAVRPHTGETKVIYPTELSDPFYTFAGGKWQLLQNGNFLIAEARAGRVFEVTPDGKTVWEWVHQLYSDKLVPEVLEGTRYPYTPEQIVQWACSPGE